MQPFNTTVNKCRVFAHQKPIAFYFHVRANHNVTLTFTKPIFEYI